MGLPTMLAPKYPTQVSVECCCMFPFSYPRELITEDREKIFCNGWGKANGKDEDIYVSSGRPLISV